MKTTKTAGGQRKTAKLPRLYDRVPSLSRAERLVAILLSHEGMTEQETAATLDVDLLQLARLKADAQSKAGVSTMSGLRSMLEHGAPFDVFISHATPDKASLVRPLAKELARLGMEVWYDEFTLKLGQSLTEEIDRGLRDAAFGLVVLSPAFFGRPWARRELRGLEQKALDKPGTLLPIWHNIGRDEIMGHSPPLADIVAVRSAGRSAKELAIRVLERVSPVLVRQLGDQLAPASRAKRVGSKKGTAKRQGRKSKNKKKSFS